MGATDTRHVGPIEEPKTTALHMDEVSRSEVRYFVPEIFTVTAKTDPNSKEVSFAWEFLRPSKREQVIAIQGANMPLSNEIGVGEFFAEFARLKDQKQEAGAEYVKPFALLRSRMQRGKERKTLPEGTWYFRLGITSDDVSECFTYTAQLGPPADAKKADEATWKSDIDGIMHGFRKFDEATAKRDEMFREIAARTDLSEAEKAVRIKYIKAEIERVTKKLGQRSW